MEPDIVLTAWQIIGIVAASIAAGGVIAAVIVVAVLNAAGARSLRF